MKNTTPVAVSALCKSVCIWVLLPTKQIVINIQMILPKLEF